MAFNGKYLVSQNWIQTPSKRRSGLLITPSVKFIVAHDTGNPGSSALANVNYYKNSCHLMSASAHIFVDDKDIIECIPVFNGPPEKAWHVLYNSPTDNLMFGYNANDSAIGVEYCYGDDINADEAYKKYIWVLSKICHDFNLDPSRSIVGHCILDPRRKTDPVTGLLHSRRTYEQLLKDVVLEYAENSGSLPISPTPVIQAGTCKVVHRLNIRKGEPNTRAQVLQVINPGTSLAFIKQVTGESINGNNIWYDDGQGNFFWSGAVL